MSKDGPTTGGKVLHLAPNDEVTPLMVIEELNKQASGLKAIFVITINTDGDIEGHGSGYASQAAIAAVLMQDMAKNALKNG